MLWMFSICKVVFYLLFFLSVFFVYNGMIFIMSSSVVFLEWEILTMNSSSILMTLLLDWMSLFFLGVVLFISSLVVFYSEDYMGADYNINRFILIVLLFVLSMALLIISPNMISILLGWDGLGLVSYCLVIYYQNVKSFNAGMLTALSNRIGDVAILMVIAWMINFGSWSYIYYLDWFLNSYESAIIGGLVVLAGMTKSAQLPFSAWLPAAMAAPTPVSALVHSSTLVTAGVYLLIRFSPMLNSFITTLLLVLSGLTMFMAGLGANYETDLSKIIALSTLSQLGLMMSILCLGFPGLAFFHLMTHALFKALLFLCAGCIIHNVGNCQDIRSMGSLSIYMPLTSSCFNTANLALCGMPFLAGFYSKDLILEMVSMGGVNIIGFFLFFISTGLTVCYSMRLSFYSMWGEWGYSSCHSLSDEGWYMLSGMLGLLFMAVVGGCVFSWLFFSTPLLIVLPMSLSMMAVVVSLLGGWIGYVLSTSEINSDLLSLKFYVSSVFAGSMWFTPLLSTYGVSKDLLLSSGNMIKSVDQGWNELIGGQGIYVSLVGGSLFNQSWQNNSLSTYLLFFAFWILVIFILFML
uniref:NADH-ubiquinone oxidoreductase chain 5 n=1 Tax=Tricholepidion gertschi TaxID=89825 RepID=Q85QS0_9INSE|nr:NADH dehydrogenase subunit 5 [Tricholepidion gertschi]AAO40217.1 NADH dehydrogenase subunit 5 [Tricholepidion gertschi]